MTTTPKPVQNVIQFLYKRFTKDENFYRVVKEFH